MSTTSDSTNPGKRKSWLFKLSIVAGVLVVLLVAIYLVATSGAFIKGVVLPKVGETMHAEITASDVSLSPWSQVVISNFKITPKGQPTLFEAREIRAKYSLSDILHGRIVVSEAGVTEPVITFVQNADGTSNVDPLTQKTPGQTQPASTSSQPPQLDIKNVFLKGARIKAVLTQTNGVKTVAHITDFDFTIDQLQNGQSSKIKIGAGVAVELSGGTNKPGALAAKLAGDLGLKLSQTLQPESISGDVKVEVTSASGAMAELKNLAAVLDCDVTQTELRKSSLRLEQSGNTLAEVRVSGPFSLSTLEGRLKVELASVDRRALNIAGAALKIDFNKTTIGSVNDIEIKQKAKVFTINGKFQINDFSATMTNGTTPTVHVQSTYLVDVDLNKSNALIRQLEISGIQNQAQILSVGLSKPLPIAWGTGAGTPDEASLNADITNFNLADWAAFAGDIQPQGRLNVALRLHSMNGGNAIDADLSTSLAGLGAKISSNTIAGLDIQANVSAHIDKFKAITLKQYDIKLAKDGANALSASGSGAVNTSTQDADIKAVLEAQIPVLLHTVKIPDANFKSGAVRFDGRVVKTKDAQTVDGTLSLTNISGAFQTSTMDRLQASLKANIAVKGDDKQGRKLSGTLDLNNLTGGLLNYKLDRLGAQLQTDIDVKGDDTQIHKLTGTLEQFGAAAGSLDVKGGINSKTKIGKFDVAVTNLNQNLLKPFVEPALSGKKLTSVSISLNTTANLETNGGISALGDLSIANFVLSATNETAAPKPLAVNFKFDAGKQADLVSVRQLQIGLTPTSRAANQINIKGQADLAKSNAINANLSLSSDGIDLTELAEQFSGGSTAPAAKPSQPTGPRAELAAMQLPVGLATVNLNISRFYLKQIEITNWQAAIRVETNHVAVNPFKLNLNGAPVSFTANADLGTPGFVYDVNLNVDKLAINKLTDVALVSSGAINGVILANVAIKGAGTTDAHIRDNLSGQVNFALTNANIQITNFLKYPLVSAVLTTTATTLQAPEVLTDPINSVSAVASIGQAKVNVQTVNLQSKAFLANVHGQIQLADPLLNSGLALPVNFGLSQSLAQRIPYFMSFASINQGYATVPDFVIIGGTLSNVKVTNQALNSVANAAKQAVKNTATQVLSNALNGSQTNGNILNNLKSSALNALKNPTGATNQTSSRTDTNAATSVPGLINKGLNLFR
jgi:hypothetical protein